MIFKINRNKYQKFIKIKAKINFFRAMLMKKRIMSTMQIIKTLVLIIKLAKMWFCRSIVQATSLKKKKINKAIIYQKGTTPINNKNNKSN